MSDLFANGMVLPLIVLLGIGWLVPQGLARVMPEGVTALMILAVVATGIIAVLAALFFAGLYLAQGAPMTAFGPSQAAFHFGRLGLMSAIIWAPVMLLSVANLPRKWVNEVW